MPAIDIYFKHGLINNSYAFINIVDRVTMFAAEKYFSSESIELTEDDFTVIFHEAGKWDQLTHDIVVRVQLHAFPERLVDTDAKATAFAEDLALEFRTMFVLDKDLTVGVSLLVTEIGWGTYTATANGKTPESILNLLRI